jgi:hypothetical protein
MDILGKQKIYSRFRNTMAKPLIILDAMYKHSSHSDIQGDDNHVYSQSHNHNRDNSEQSKSKSVEWIFFSDADTDLNAKYQAIDLSDYLNNIPEDKVTCNYFIYRSWSSFIIL